jgi:WD40 repeat protein
MVEAVAYSRDGRILIAAGGSGNLPGLTLNPGIVTLWDTKTDKMLHSFRALDVTVRKVALSPDGKLLAVSPLDHLLKVNVWDISQLLPKESPTKK